MKIKVINTGKSAESAEGALNKALSELGDIELKLLSDSGMRVIIVYEEKKVAKGLQKNTDNGSIKERKGQTKEVTSEDQDATNNGAGSSAPKKTRQRSKPKK
jgi:hypothetical protein